MFHFRVNPACSAFAPGTLPGLPPGAPGRIPVALGATSRAVLCADSQFVNGAAAFPANPFCGRRGRRCIQPQGRTLFEWIREQALVELFQRLAFVALGEAAPAARHRQQCAMRIPALEREEHPSAKRRGRGFLK